MRYDLTQWLVDDMGNIDNDCMQEPLEKQVMSKSVSDILTMLRAVANPVEGHALVDFHSYRLMSESRRIAKQGAERAARDSKFKATLTYACASATAIGVLQMLSSFFE